MTHDSHTAPGSTDLMGEGGKTGKADSGSDVFQNLAAQIVRQEEALAACREALQLAQDHLLKHDETCHAIGKIEAVLRRTVDA